MGQVSYGTITITDTTDKTVYIGYANDAQGTNLSNIPSPQRIFVGININIEDYSSASPPLPPASDPNWTWSEYVGGDGVSVLQTKDIYFLKRTTDSVPTAPGNTVNVTSQSTDPAVWTTSVPTYIPNAVYYTSIQTDLDNNTYPHSTAVIDQALTDMNYNAYLAQSLAQSANENANGALSIATGVAQHFFYIGTDYSAGIPAGAYVAEQSEESFKANPTSGNLITRADGIYIRKGTTLLTSLTGTALTFYNPSTNNAQLVIGSSGALQSGNYSRGSDSKFAATGTKIDLTSGDIITQYFRLSQGGESGGPNAGAYIYGTIEALSGRIGTGYTPSGGTETNYWEIGNFTDYNLHNTAKLVGHGSSFIQLGDSSTWRLATNRIHTGWYIPSDSYLHFLEFTDGSTTKRWDYGLHVPTSKDDKFLYIRNASASTDLSNLIYDLEDTNPIHYWTYKFWIDGEGKVHAPGFYIGNSTTPIGGGVGTVAEKLMAGAGSSTQPVYFRSDTEIVEGQTIDHTGEVAAVSWDVNSSINTSSTTNDSNVATIGAIKSYVTGRGYVTSSGVTSVTLTQSAPITVSNSGTAITSTGSRTIGLADGYGDTKNPYASKTKNYVLAAPSDAAGIPSFRALVSADIPDLSGTYLTSHQSVTNKAATLDWGTSKTIATIGSTNITVSLPSNPNTNTTYTFTGGANKFTVTPSSGDAYDVSVTPSITNNITGSGTSGYLAKFTGGNTIGNGPAIGSGTTKFLREDGTWQTPGGTYSLPMAKYDTLGGVKPAYSSTGAATLTTAAASNSSTPTIAAKSTTSGRYYAIEIDKNGILFVNVPWTNVNSNYLTSESDPIFSASVAASITSTDISNWNAKTSNTGTVTSVAASGSNGITISGSPITINGTITIGLNLSTAINGLGEGTSAATRDDYIVAQYAGGGTTTTTYHRRKLSNIFKALNSSDITTALGFTPTDNVGTVTSVKVQGSNGLTGGGTVTTSGTITISHDDTSSQASSSNSGRTYIQSVILDSYGHVTSLSTATETITNYVTHLYVNNNTTTNTNTTTALTNGNVYLHLYDDSTKRDSHKISGNGAATVTSDTSGNIIVTSPISLVDVGFANGIITFTKSDNTTIPITTDNFVITQAAGATALVRLKSGSTTEYEGYSAGGATTKPVYFDSEGHPVAVTSIPYSLLTGTPSSMTPTSHTHGNISNDGKITSTATIANGDKLVIVDIDNTAGSKITGSSITFGTSTSTFLSNKGTWETPVGTTYTFDGTYSASTNKAATVSTVTNAINALDGSINGSPGAGKTFTAFTQTDGKVTATFGDISITKSQISDFPSEMTPAAHSHTLSIADSTGTSSKTLAHGGKYQLTAGGSTYIFTMPAAQTIPTIAASKTTGITASTTATKTTLGTAFTIPNVTSAGSASNWVFEDVACDDITAWSAGSFTRGTFNGGSGSFTQGNFSGGSGSFTASVSSHVLSFSHTHIAATHEADSHTHTAATHAADSFTAPSLTYSAKTASHVKSGGNGSAPTLGTAFTVPNVTGNTSATVSITDNGHTHTLS